jgi:hypothetical protein
MVHSCCTLILQWWNAGVRVCYYACVCGGILVATSVLVCGSQRYQEFPDKEYEVPNRGL